MNKFSIDFVSDMDHEHLMAEISFMGQRLCLIEKEQSNEKMEIEFLTDLYTVPESLRVKFNLSDFLEVVRAAREELSECE